VVPVNAAIAFAAVSAGALGLLVGPIGPPPPRRPMGSRASGRRPLREAPGWLRETTATLPLPPLRRWRARRRDAQLVGALERMASGLRAGQALSTAFVTVADEMPPPLGDDLAAHAIAVRSGGALTEIMTRWAHDPSGSRAT